MYGGTRTTVVERPRRGVVAWVRNHTPFVADAGTVEVVETEEVDSMSLKELERIAVYQLSHGGIL